MKYFAQLFTGLIIELDKPLHNYHTEAGYVIDKCVINGRECYNTVFATAHVYITWEEKETSSKLDTLIADLDKHFKEKGLKSKPSEKHNKLERTPVEQHWNDIKYDNHESGRAIHQSYYGGMKRTETGELEYINGIQDYFFKMQKHIIDKMFKG